MEGDQNIVIIVFLGTFIMVIIGLILITFVSLHRKKYLLQQNELQRIENEREQAILISVIAAQEQERNRIAKNLHDSVGAELSMVKLNLSQQIYFLSEESLEKSKLREELNNLDKTIDAIAAVCKNLYPLSLQSRGIVITLQELIHRINLNGLVKAVFQCEVSDAQIGTSQERLLNVYRVFQEVLNNLLKHSSCKQLNVALTLTHHQLRIDFTHDGKMFTNENERRLREQNKGIGLQSILAVLIY